MADDLFATGYVRTPYWWEDFKPPEDAPDELPAHVDVLIVGAGYAGISCALTLAEQGVKALVLDSGRLGQGAATRSGGQVTGGVNVQAKAARAGSHLPPEQQRPAREGKLRDAAMAMNWLETMMARHAIDCSYHPTGRLTALWTKQHGPVWASRLAELNELTGANAQMLTAEEVREELGTTLYHGAALIGRAGHLHPAQLYGGLLGAARRAGAMAHGMTAVRSLTRRPGHYEVKTDRGTVRADQVVLATNGYPSEPNGKLRRNVVPVTSHMIATEELPDGLAAQLITHDRGVSETRRVVSHYRLSPDGKRLLFGGRARFVPTGEDTTARLLHRMMVQRFPQLKDIRITHSWGGNVAMTLDYMPHMGSADGLHWIFGCNGSGVVLMPWLGQMMGRKILERPNGPICAYDGGVLPQHPLYFGNPWFLFAIGSWYQFRDTIDRLKAS